MFDIILRVVLVHLLFIIISCYIHVTHKHKNILSSLFTYNSRLVHMSNISLNFPYNADIILYILLESLYRVRVIVLFEAGYMGF